MTKWPDPFAAYVAEILQQLPDGLTPAGFYDRCQPDINAGYRDEVDAAWLAYQAANRATIHGKRK